MSEKRKPGRPKKDRGPQDFYDSAEAYLRAVVEGRTPPDAARIAAAKCLISYEKSKIRVPVESPAPAEMRRKEKANTEKNLLLDFERKAAKIRKKHADLKRPEKIGNQAPYESSLKDSL